MYVPHSVLPIRFTIVTNVFFSVTTELGIAILKVHNLLNILITLIKSNASTMYFIRYTFTLNPR